MSLSQKNRYGLIPWVGGNRGNGERGVGKAGGGGGDCCSMGRVSGLEDKQVLETRGGDDRPHSCVSSY